MSDPLTPVTEDPAVESRTFSVPRQSLADVPSLPDEQRVTAASGSDLATLRERLTEARQKLYLELRVPRWKALLGIDMVTRYGPLDESLTRSLQERHRGDEANDSNVEVFADVLVNACLGIFVIRDGKRAVIPTAQAVSSSRTAFHKFEEDLWEELAPRKADGVDVLEKSAIECCRRLYFTDGDLQSAAFELLDWSVQRSEQVEKDFPTP